MLALGVLAPEARPQSPGATPQPPNATAQPSEATLQSPFTMNGWQFHEYDIPKLEEAIRRAPDYGVNFFIFSHRLFRSVEGFLVSDEDFDPEHRFPHLDELYEEDNHTQPHASWQKDVRHLAALADSVGIPYYLWIHEFDDIPHRFRVDDGERVNLDHPDLPAYLDERYERLLEALPGTAGFVLTLHESDYKVFRDSEVQSELSVPERIYKVAKLIYDVASRHGKQLILRSFFYEPLEMEYFREALARLPVAVIVMSKTTYHEFHPFYPPDALHGDVGGKRQILEIDLGVEKAWSHHGAYAQLENIRRYVRRARDLGLAGMVGRMRLYWDETFEDSHEINLYAFSRFMENPDLSVEEVARDWARRRFPGGAVPHIASAMLRTEFINHHGRYHLENWFTKTIGEQWGDYEYYFGHVLQRTRYKWSGDPADSVLVERLYHPDPEILARAVAEKDDVINQVLAGIEDLDRAARYATPAQLAPLREDFAFLLDAARLQREWVRAYFAQRLYVEDPREEYRMIAEDALRRLQELERTPGMTWGLDPATGRRYNIDRFVLEMRWRMANLDRAEEMDERILDEIRLKAQVRKN